MQTEEKIRQTVRQTYGNVARQGHFDQSQLPNSHCCGSNLEPIESQSIGCGCGANPIDPKILSTQLGYTKEDMEAVPDGANLGLGCGSPKTIANIAAGETVIDLGSGGGFDCFLAAKEVGENGKVIGVDMTAEMISRSRENASKANVQNVEFRLGEIEHLPLEDGVADLIMSNCVINLSPAKQHVFNDAFRVLKPGGRIAISDILATKPLPDDIKKDLSLVSACIGGAATIAKTKQMLETAGFDHIRITPKTVSQELIDEWLPQSRVGEYVVSAYIEARKTLKSESKKEN
ncbi:MAG: arsenite methyltransferase [Desulfobacula sp.]|nr:arsenite methyltransferase [Desulfobacula sp.]